MEPPVSDPSEIDTVPAATATAEPPEDPPAMTPASKGLTGVPKALVSEVEPIANSSMLVLPTGTAPAASKRATAVASYGERNSPKIFDAQVVRPSDITMLSLTAMGTPASDPRFSPAALRLSSARARVSAESPSTEMYAFRFFVASILASAACTKDSDETSPD